MPPPERTTERRRGCGKRMKGNRPAPAAASAAFQSHQLPQLPLSSAQVSPLVMVPFHLPCHGHADGQEGRASSWWLGWSIVQVWVTAPPTWMMVMTVSGTGIFILSHQPFQKDICLLPVIPAFPVGELTSSLRCTCHPPLVPMACQGPVHRARSWNCLMCTFAAAVEQGL